MSNTFLDEEQSPVLDYKGLYSKYQLKIKHLNELSMKIHIENEQLRSKVKDLELQKMNFLISQFNQNTVISSLSKELEQERQRNLQLSKRNEQLQTTILLNAQLGIETKRQFSFYSNRYEQKILEMRQGLQLKEVQIQALEEKYERFKSLQLPLSVKNANRYTTQLHKYETLIQNLVKERNKDSIQNVEEVNSVLKCFEKSEMQLKNRNLKKEKSCKNISSNTEIRSKLSYLNDESQGSNSALNKEGLDVLFLRVHLQLRQLKRKYRQKLEENMELRSKDKVMKQGYMTLTKEMQKIKIENCQLNIQLQHLAKKIKTSKQIAKAKSANSIQKYTKQRENAEQKIQSDISIEGNLSQFKNCLKVTLPSQTKYDTLSVSKSHNFDEKIQNIQGILSLDSDPDFSNLKQIKNQLRNEENDDDLSICEQNQLDLSISLNTSGFEAPRNSKHQISNHIIFTEFF